MNNYGLRYLLNIALKYWVAILLSAILTAGVAFSYINFLAEPKYTARGSIVVTNGRIINQEDSSGTATKVENSDIVASINFVDTIVDILKTPGIYEKLSKELDSDYTFGQLMGKTSISKRSTNTLFIDIRFTSSDPKDAINILNKYLELAPDYIRSMVVDASASIVKADSSYWDYPSNFTIISLGAILGAALMYLLVFFIYSSSNVIRDGEDFEEICGIDVIGIVPDFAASKSRERKYGGYYGTGGNKNG